MSAQHLNRAVSALLEAIVAFWGAGEQRRQKEVYDILSSLNPEEVDKKHLADALKELVNQVVVVVSQGLGFLKTHVVPLVRHFFGDSVSAWSTIFGSLLADLIVSGKKDLFRDLTDVLKDNAGFIGSLEEPVLANTTRVLDRLREGAIPGIYPYVPDSCHCRTWLLNLLARMGWYEEVVDFIKVYQVHIHANMCVDETDHTLLYELVLNLWYEVAASAATEAATEAATKAAIGSFQKLIKLFAATGPVDPFQEGGWDMWEIVFQFLLEMSLINQGTFLHTHLEWLRDLLGAIPKMYLTTEAFTMLVFEVVRNQWDSTLAFKRLILQVLSEAFGENASFPPNLAHVWLGQVVFDSFPSNGETYFPRLRVDMYCETLRFLFGLKGVSTDYIDPDGQNIMFYAITTNQWIFDTCVNQGVPVVTDASGDTALTWLLKERGLLWWLTTARLLWLLTLAWRGKRRVPGLLPDPFTSLADPVSEVLPLIRNMFVGLADKPSVANPLIRCFRELKGRAPVENYGFQLEELYHWFIGRHPSQLALLNRRVLLSGGLVRYLSPRGKCVVKTLVVSAARQQGQVVPKDVWWHILSFCGWDWFLNSSPH